MTTRLEYRRQIRKPILAERIAPYRIITTEMIFEMFAEQNMGHSNASRFLYLYENHDRLTKWCGCDGVYIVDEAMKQFFAKYDLNYKW